MSFAHPKLVDNACGGGWLFYYLNPLHIPSQVEVHLEEVNPSLNVSSNWKNFLSLSFLCFEKLVNLRMKHKPFRAMVIIAIKPCQEDEIFYRVENFTSWELFLMCVWSFLSFVWFFSTLYCKVCEFIQTLIEN
jgi:hypothetical protein